MGRATKPRPQLSARVPWWFGAETALTIDLLRRGMRVTEVEVDLAHRATGADWRGQLHRARQFADVAAALAARSLLPRGSRAARTCDLAERPSPRQQRASG